MADITFYADAGGDGYINCVSELGTNTWDNVHDKTSLGGSDNVGDTATTGFIYTRYRTTGSFYTINRVFFPFDTSGLPDDATVTAATLSVYVTEDRDNHTTGSNTIGVVESQQASDTALAGTDFDNCGDAVDNPTELATRKTLGSIGSGAYTDFTLNASGLALISKTGYSSFGMRTGWDMDDSPPTDDQGAGSGLGIYFSDQTGTTNDPKLIVTYTEAAGGIAASRRFVVMS